jgi:NAD(P)-binding Rossmann-like domain
MPTATIIGSGPNGLSAAIVLAAARVSTTVFERNVQIGGACSTAETTLPNFRQDLGSSVNPLGVASPFFRSLPIKIPWIEPTAPCAHPLDPENDLQTLHAFFEAEVRGRTDEKDVINYTFIKDNWFVVSGTNFKGFEFYTKLWRYNDHWVTFNFAYPRSKRKVYEPMLLELLRNFTPTCRGNGITE